MSKTENWPFDQPPNAAAITTRQVLENNLPILCVIHYEDDHSWGFFCGTTCQTVDGRVIGMSAALKRDPSLAEVAHLPPGKSAHRVSMDDPWVIE